MKWIASLTPPCMLLDQLWKLSVSLDLLCSRLCVMHCIPSVEFAFRDKQLAVRLEKWDYYQGQEVLSTAVTLSKFHWKVLDSFFRPQYRTNWCVAPCSYIAKRLMIFSFFVILRKLLIANNYCLAIIDRLAWKMRLSVFTRSFDWWDTEVR